MILKMIDGYGPDISDAVFALAGSTRILILAVCIDHFECLRPRQFSKVACFAIDFLSAVLAVFVFYW